MHEGGVGVIASNNFVGSAARARLPSERARILRLRFRSRVHVRRARFHFLALCPLLQGRSQHDDRGPACLSWVPLHALDC
jgi:hypothetical protein